MRSNRKLIYGVGVNDANYKLFNVVDGKQVQCPYYSRWANMLKRCYCIKYQESQKTYIGCKVCDEWLTFSNFKSWMQLQDWNGKYLDKDIIIKGCKVYSPESCAFVDNMTNTFTTDSAASRGDCMIGVHFNKNSKKYTAKCCNPFTGKAEYLGGFTHEIDAHKAWKSRKAELAVLVARRNSDYRVIMSLLNMYK